MNFADVISLITLGDNKSAAELLKNSEIVLILANVIYPKYIFGEHQIAFIKSYYNNKLLFAGEIINFIAKNINKEENKFLIFHLIDDYHIAKIFVDNGAKIKIKNEKGQYPYDVRQLNFLLFDRTIEDAISYVRENQLANFIHYLNPSRNINNHLISFEIFKLLREIICQRNLNLDKLPYLLKYTKDKNILSEEITQFVIDFIKSY